MTTEDLGAMNLAGSSNNEFLSYEMDDSLVQNDAVVTLTNHAGPFCLLFLGLVAFSTQLSFLLIFCCGDCDSQHNYQ